MAEVNTLKEPTFVSAHPFSLPLLRLQHLRQWWRTSHQLLQECSACANDGVYRTSTCRDRSTCVGRGVHRTYSCKRVHRASACRVGVASACGLIHRTCACRVIRGTGSSKIRHASVSARVQCASVSRDLGASTGSQIRRTSASLPHRDARGAQRQRQRRSTSRSASCAPTGMCALPVPMVQHTAPSSGSDRNDCSSDGVHCRTLRGASFGRVLRASINGGGIARQKPETLRFHFRLTAAASSRDVATSLSFTAFARSRDVVASLSFNCCCEQQRRSGITSFNLPAQWCHTPRQCQPTLWRRKSRVHSASASGGVHFAPWTRGQRRWCGTPHRCRMMYWRGL